MNQGKFSFVSVARVFAAAACAITVASGLVGCGSGEELGLDSKLDQGRWVSTAIDPRFTAVVQPVENSRSMMWILENDASSLLKIELSSSGVGLGAGLSGKALGKRFFLGTGVSSNVAGDFNATISRSQAGLNQMVSVYGLLPQELMFTHVESMAETLLLSRSDGHWFAGAQGLNVNWRVSAGRIEGESTAGCTYVGEFLTTTGVGVYRTEFVENCATKSTSFAGISTINEFDNRITVVATTPNDADAVAIFFSKGN